jgi:gliding motility-associated lipoprotein GldD
MKHKNLSIILLLVLFFGFTGCNDVPVPKPKGYHRICFPEKKYQLFDTTYPYSFEYPVYSKIEFDKTNSKGPYFINLLFPSYQGTVYISYKTIRKNLDTLIEDSHTFVNKHIPKATSINRKVYINDAEKVYGLTFDIEGTGAASPYQFYLTDSTTHFFRAALYFNHVPNNDSLAPVIDFIKADLSHLIETFKWKKLK